MLDKARVGTRLPTQDLARARRLYADKLGLEPTEERPGGLLHMANRAENASAPVGPLKLLSPLLARVGQRIWDQRLARTKTLLESSDSQP
jgi:catechol 2,3-dioxygenase-like lactoylglutathione lyase family enzyme